MKHQITLPTRTIEYSFKTSLRSRTMRLVVYGERDIRVTAPRWVGQGTIERFIVQKSDWVLRKIEQFVARGPMIHLRSSTTEYRAYREQAYVLAQKKVAELNIAYGFTFRHITIRNQKSRWGSCSTKGNLSFNYKIIHLPEKLVDYIVVHELCHLGQFNHSAQFWNLVAQTIPDHKERRKELKKYRF